MDGPSPYKPPAAPLGDVPAKSPPVAKLERLLFWILVGNAIAGTFFVGLLLINGQAHVVIAAILIALLVIAYVSAASMYRQPFWGVVGGAIFYLPQMVSY